MEKNKAIDSADLGIFNDNEPRENLSPSTEQTSRSRPVYKVDDFFEERLD